jgi:uncharacterized protein YdhG (YjbR/CyaY superfamily)
MMQKGKFTNVDEYIALYPAPVRKGLEILRKTIKQAAPRAEETISYNMPAYRLNGMLVFFGGGKNHYGFYPTPGPILIFKEQLKTYETSKGAIRFPHDKPIPTKLVSAIVKWRVMEDQEKAVSKQKKQIRNPKKLKD